MSKKCTRLWREAHFTVNMLKAPGVRTTFGRSDVVPPGRRKGCISRNDGRRVTFDNLKRICKDAFSVAGAVQETSSSELLGGPSGDFLRGVAFWSIRSSGLAEMILRDRCSTSYDLASLFCGKRSSLDRWTGKSQNALVRGRQLCTQLSIFEGSLAEFFRF